MVRVVGAAASVDVEAGIIGLLRGVVPPGTTVATEIPRQKGVETFPARMVRVTRTTGTMQFSPAHDMPSVLVECWAAPGPDAFALAASCRVVMLELWNTPILGAWYSHASETSGVTNFPDPRTQNSRYQFVHQITVTT